MLPLDGLRVVEHGRTGIASYCGRLLADAGADVIKVEAPDGDPARRRGPFPADVPDPERSGLFFSINVNKRGVRLDLGRPKDRDAFMALLDGANVLVTDHPPLEAQRLGLTWRRLRRTHPKLLFTSITPFGESGPYRDYHANDHVIYNMGGLAYATPGLPDHVDDPRKEPPLRPSTPIAEFIAGAVGATSTLMAAMLTVNDGLGRHVEVSAQEAVAAMLYRDISNYSYGHTIVGRRPVQAALMPNAIMPCKDGHVVLAVPYSHMWAPFKEVMGNPDWADLEVFEDAIARGANWDALEPLLREWTMQHTGEEIMEMVQSKGIPTFAAFSLARLLDSNHEKERGYFWQVRVDNERTAKVAGSPFIFSRTPLKLRSPAPKLGQHDEEVLGRLSSDASPWSADGWSSPDGAPDKASRLPLEGVRVLDFGQVVAIPYAAQLLAWMGADVITVETRQRLLSRGSPPYAHGIRSPNTSGHTNLLATNKRSLTLNLTTPEALDLAYEMVKVVDVVVENFSTGTMEKMGLGYDKLRRLRPDLVMLSLGGFGRKGEMSRYASMHSGANMVSGLGSVIGQPGDRPRIMGSIFPDPLSGMYSCLAILEALHYRRRTGLGQHIDFAMSEVLTHLIPEAVFDYSVNGREPEKRGNRDRLEAPQGVYRCKGWDAWIGVSVASEEEWQALCGALGQPDLAADPRFATNQARMANHDELDAIIGRWTKGHTSREAMRLLQDAGVPAGPSFNAKDLLNDPHLNARGLIKWIDHPEAGRRRMLGLAWRISDTPSVRIRHAPLLGQHTEEVLESVLGIPHDEVERMAQEKVTY